MSLKRSIHRKPLHIQIADVLRKKVVPRFKPGEKIDAESRLAPQLGVSVVTLRQSLSVLEHEGILVRRHGSGTYVADRSAQQHVAIATRFAANVKDTSFQLRVFRLLGSVLQELRCQHRFYFWPETGPYVAPEEFAEAMGQNRVSGVVFVAAGPDDDSMRKLERGGIPLVVTSEQYPHGVVIDYDGVVREGTRYLLERGRRRIALMQWSSPGEESMSARVLEIFKRLLAEHGAPYEERWVRRAVVPDEPGAGWEQFRELWAASKEKPDGLLVTDDILFRDVALGILESRIEVPGQLQVAALANKGSGLSYPFPVAFLEVDPREYARAMAERLVHLIRKETIDPRTLYVAPRLVVPGAPVGDRLRAGD